MKLGSQLLALLFATTVSEVFAHMHQGQGHYPQGGRGNVWMHRRGFVSKALESADLNQSSSRFPLFPRSKTLWFASITATSLPPPFSWTTMPATAVSVSTLSFRSRMTVTPAQREGHWRYDQNHRIQYWNMCCRLWSSH